MEAANGPNVQNEQLLWHGTSADTVQHINNNGFNRSYCGKNGRSIVTLSIYFLFLANVNSRSCSLYVVVRPSVVCLSSVCL